MLLFDKTTHYIGSIRSFTAIYYGTSDPATYYGGSEKGYTDYPFAG
ncbi:hypothetical protein [Chitinophaga agrisoli]|nr:hypothetical protein [Chitinophaga agrisoli]